MSLAFQSSDSIKQALFEELQNILSADKNIRTGAEENVKKLEFTEGDFILLSVIEKKNNNWHSVKNKQSFIG